jgi:glycosyltransferase involved in cell wall biosynthesis
MSNDKRLKIAYISSYDPLDKSIWSGTAYSIYRSLQNNVGDVNVLGPCEPWLQLTAGKIRSRVLRLLTGKKYNYGHSESLAEAYANFFEKKLDDKQYDLIVAPSASCILAKLKTNIPIVYITDSTVAASLNYHDNLTGLSKSSVEESLSVEQGALNNADLCIFSSQWAADSAINDFKTPAEKIKILPYGANFELLPAANEIKYDSIPDSLNLLFVGVYWENKGGERAYNCLTSLLKKGVKATLTICGCTPPDKFIHPSVEVIPFLNKNNPADAQRLSELFSQANFLLLPTRFDCTPIVICEASAYGVPVLCANTGGVLGHISPGINGYIIDYNDMGDAYAAKIMEVMEDPSTYTALRSSSRKMYDEKLNWNTWTEKFKEIIKPVLK